MLMPLQLIGSWLRGVVALAIIGFGIWLINEGYRESRRPVPSPNRAKPPSRIDDERQHAREWSLGFNTPTAMLAGGAILLLYSVGGGLLLERLRSSSAPPPAAPPLRPTVHQLSTADGSELWIEEHGTAGGPTVILTHGWGLDREEWRYAVSELAAHCRLLLWDLPGLGKSKRPAGAMTLDLLAANLNAVIAFAGNGPVILVGHSIGGMIILTFCRNFPEILRTRICGIVLAHSTFTNPVHTAAWAPVYRALQKPLLEPLCHLMIWLSPLVWILNILSYLNGSAHRSTRRSSFSGNESRWQLDFISKYQALSSPAVVARGFLAMFRYDASDILTSIAVLTLVVSGSRDPLCSPDASSRMVAEIPRSSSLTLEGMKHSGLFENHALFHEKVHKFIAACVEDAGAEAA